MAAAASCYTNDYGIWPFAAVILAMTLIILARRPIARFMAENAHGRLRDDPLSRSRSEKETHEMAMVWQVLLTVIPAGMIVVSILAAAGSLPC